MLSILLALNFNLNAQTKLINTKTQTSFIVLHKETTKWDFADLQLETKPFTYTQNSKNSTYYVRFAKELTQSDLPSYADYEKIKARKGTNAVRCNSYTKTCDILSTVYEYDWSTITDTDPFKGVLYFADGKPFLNSEAVYEEWEVHYEFRCDSSSTSIKPEMFVDTPFASMPRLYLLFKNKQSCGQTWTIEPTATPTPFNPDCTVYYREDGNKNRAIYFNLSEWNGGALGIPIDVKTTSGNKILFWEPCERMINCPWGGNCHGASMSSAWLCDEQLDCTNFTIISGGEKSRVDTDLIDGTDISKGFRIKYEDVSKSTLHVDITCKGDYPNDHVLFDPTGVYDTTNNVLTISGSTYDACPKDVPEPVPPVEKCRFNLTQAGPAKNEYFIDMDLAVLPKKSKLVEVRGDGDGKQMMLHMSPCDSFACPDDYDCDGDEDMTVLLCETQSSTAAPPVCIAYGILDHGVSAGLKGNYIINGATTYYSGDRGRTAEVDWKCKEGMISHNYDLPDKVYLKNGQLSIDVQSIDACMKGSGPTPTPPPFVKPDTPEEQFPTPSPVPSPQAMYYFEDLSQNEYIIIDLTQLASSKTFTGETEIAVNGLKGSIHTEFHPWNLLSYPSQWGNSTVFDKANLWQCWFSDGFNTYCHPIADKRQPGLNINLQKANDIDSGVRIHYNGAFGAQLEIDISCDQSATHRLDITNIVMDYTHFGNTHRWYLNTSLEIACSNKFQPAVTPYPSNTPEPSGETPETSFKTEIDGQTIELDLKKLKSVDGYVASGFSGKYAHNQLLFSPIKKLNCPKGKACPDNYQEGNAWLCVNDSTYCYPIGNMDYGLTMRKLGTKDDLYGGVTVNYDGGLYGSEVHFNFFCDETLRENELLLKPIDIAPPPGKIHAITFLTSNVCPSIPMTLRQTTGGAYFLLILAVAFVGYFGIGTFVMYVLTGGISVPFESFWTEFFECVTTAVVFIFTCGKSRTIAAYDNI